jgi:hypothetical protein
VWNENKGFNENLNFTQGKYEVAAAVISNCYASSRKLIKNTIYQNKTH